ncbi:hypothetical protein D3C86_1891730 [compost metagenome]
MKAVLDSVSGRQMTGHEQLDAQVFKTTYEGGISIITNYNDHAVNAGGQQVEAYGYAVTGG